MAHVLGHIHVVTTSEFRIPTDRRERCAQLVAGISNELADLRFARSAGGESFVDVVEHAVERVPQLANFGIGFIDLNSFRQSDFTRRELHPGNSLRRFAHSFQRTQGDGDALPSGKNDETHDDKHEDENERSDSRHGAIDCCGRQSHQQGGAVL